MRIMIVGCGRTGAGLAQTLSLRGHAVTVVDQDPAAFERLGTAFGGQTVSGAGFDRPVLLRAGIEQADGLAAVTGSDEANVVVGRVAREVFRVPRVVARLYDPHKAEVYGRLTLQTIAPVTWGIQRIAELLTSSWLEPALSLGGGEVDLLAAEVWPPVAGRTVADLTVPGEIHVAAVTRTGRAFLPAPTTTLQEGDLLSVLVLAASVERLKALLGHA